MIRHLVILRMDADDPDERERLIRPIEEGLLALPSVLPDLRSIAVRRDAADWERNGDCLVEATFDDLEGVQTYLDHPDHQAVSRLIRASVRVPPAIIDVDPDPLDACHLVSLPEGSPVVDHTPHAWRVIYPTRPLEMEEAWIPSADEGRGVTRRDRGCGSDSRSPTPERAAQASGSANS